MAGGQTRQFSFEQPLHDHTHLERSYESPSSRRAPPRYAAGRHASPARDSRSSMAPPTPSHRTIPYNTGPEPREMRARQQTEENYSNARRTRQFRNRDVVDTEDERMVRNSDANHHDPFATPRSSRQTNPFDEREGRSELSSPEHSPYRDAARPSHSRGMSDMSSQSLMNYHQLYHGNSRGWDDRLPKADINPNDIDDRDDDDFAEQEKGARNFMGFQKPLKTQSGVATAGGAGAIMGTLSGLMSRRVTPTGAEAGPSYSHLRGGSTDAEMNEKSEWLRKQTSGRRSLKWVICGILVLALIGGITGGVVAGVTKAHQASSSGSSTSGATAASDDDGTTLTKDSSEIKALMNNPALHKVFPAVDYTPLNAQYPACLTNPPAQSNVTKDVAVLSQLTNTIRLYGTDCNQTQMVLQALSDLSLTSMKLWLGVWLDNNQTTNTRGIGAMYDILQKYTSTPFKGVIIGNEVLFRQDLSEEQLGEILADAKTNFTNLKIDLPVATSDLGNDWTASLAGKVDIVMSNIHPFFAGVTAEQAASWTWNFWQTHDVMLTDGSTQHNVISETGWPSGGGTDCGQAETCTTGSVAGIDEMNTFMAGFVCQSLKNGTDFFWFEAFDEPWKKALNTPGKEWEDKWGLMDADRNVKAGIKIPDCGGQTVT